MHKLMHKLHDIQATSDSRVKASDGGQWENTIQWENLAGVKFGVVFNLVIQPLNQNMMYPPRHRASLPHDNLQSKPERSV